MKKIGIFGSSFNPIHIGHLIICERAREELDLDEILLIPTLNPYHKRVDLASFNDRVKMLKASVSDNPNFRISEIEADIIGNSYSLNVIKRLKDIQKADYYFIVGSDSLEKIHTWFRYEEFLSEIKLIVFKRPNHDVDELIQKYKKNTEIYYFDDVQIEISSSDIRKRIKHNKSTKYMLLEKTIEYIEDNSLYKLMEYEDIVEDLRKKLKPSRFEHVLRVVETALDINSKLNLELSEEKVRLAAVLHDCAKDLEQIYFEMFQEKYSLDEGILNPPFLAHTKLGVIVAKEVYGVMDEEIIESIRNHTTGKANMSTLDKLIYLADYIEPGRQFPEAEIARKGLENGLDSAIIQVLNQEIEYHGKKNSIMDMRTIEARDYILRGNNEQT